VLELDDLFVDPDAMRRGVARQLMLRIVTEARREGIARIEVTANMHASGFYAAVGFVAGSPVDLDFGHGTRMHLDVAGFLRAQSVRTRPGTTESPASGTRCWPASPRRD
jgi:GNAT superfamily N-acetyltransferase